LAFDAVPRFIAHFKAWTLISSCFKVSGPAMIGLYISF
jgi:hypothetical protein